MTFKVFKAFRRFSRFFQSPDKFNVIQGFLKVFQGFRYPDFILKTELSPKSANITKTAVLMLITDVYLHKGHLIIFEQLTVILQTEIS